MSTKSLRISSIPADHQAFASIEERPSSILLVEHGEGNSFYVALYHPEQRELSDEESAVVLADLFREGWIDVARPFSPPPLQEGMLYQGIEMSRTSPLSGRETDWKVVCAAPTALEEEFHWKRLIEAFSEYHRLILSSPENGQVS